MDKILISWHDLVMLEFLMDSLVKAHVPTTIIENSKPQSYLMLVNSADVSSALEFLNSDREALGLPDELIEQLNTRHGL